MWGKVSCLRKQHDGRDWASNCRSQNFFVPFFASPPETGDAFLRHNKIIMVKFSARGLGKDKLLYIAVLDI